MSESNKFETSVGNNFPTSTNQPNLLPKVIYFPQQWSDPIISEEILQDPISAEVVDPIESNKQSSLIEATIIDSSEEQLPQDIEWFTVARQLRQQNRELIKTVVDLEQAFTESQHQLHQQKLRFRNTETLLTQQTQELSQTQGQITQLNWELEQAKRINQKQKLTLDHLTKLFEDTQQQAAQVERECAFLKQDNNEKTQQIIFLEQQIQELRSRLHRQQRYTLQYKAALDQCLEFPQTQIDHSVSLPAPKVTSIQPWSSNCQQLALNSSPNFSREVNSCNSGIEDELTTSISVTLNEDNLASETEINLTHLNNDIDENEEDDFLNEFFASFETDEPIVSKPLKKEASSNWPSPLITSISKSSTKFVELPNFLRNSSH